MQPEAQEVGGDAGGDDFDEYLAPGALLLSWSLRKSSSWWVRRRMAGSGGDFGVVCLPDEGGGDDGHGADTPELDHGEETDEVVELGVLGSGKRMALDGIDEELDRGRGSSRESSRPMALVFVELFQVVHVTTRTVTRL
jgi:hypothetical protein